MLLVFYILYNISKDRISNVVCKSKKMLSSKLKYLCCKIMTTTNSASIACIGLIVKIQCIWKAIMGFVAKFTKSCISKMAKFCKNCISTMANSSTEPNICEDPVEVLEIIKFDTEPDQNNKEEQHTEEMNNEGAEIKDGFEDIDENMKCEEQKEVIENIKCEIENIKCDVDNIKCEIENIKCDVDNIKCDIGTTTTAPATTMASTTCTTMASTTTMAPTGTTAKPHTPSKWSYHGETGPLQWPTLFPDHCAGKSQSPINIVHDSATPISFPTIKFENYDSITVANTEVLNNGHTLKLSASGNTAKMTGGPYLLDYEFLQLHLHWPSEHTIDGKQFVLEMHMVHKWSDVGLDGKRPLEVMNGLGVSGLLFEISEDDNEALAPLVEVIPSLIEPESKTKLVKPISIMDLINPAIAGGLYSLSLIHI